MTVNRQNSALAVQLRRDQTDVERTLWHALRNRQLADATFRRQVPFGPYIVDFLCLEARLIIEIDGGQHGGQDDQSRQHWLERQGFRVMRFWNNDVADNLSGVLETIAGALA